MGHLYELKWIILIFLTGLLFARRMSEDNKAEDRAMVDKDTASQGSEEMDVGFNSDDSGPPSPGKSSLFIYCMLALFISTVGLFYVRH